MSFNFLNYAKPDSAQEAFNLSCRLWPDKNERFFLDVELFPLLQIGPHCVATTLAILSGAHPQLFQNTINTQDPTSWSLALQQWGMKLAYCPTDARKLKFYIPELVALYDLFALSYYTTLDKNIILGDPNDQGWICGSHIVAMYKDQIIDPQAAESINAFDHYCNNFHTKRIFRVVPSDYPRNL